MAWPKRKQVMTQRKFLFRTFALIDRFVCFCAIR